MQNYHNMVQQVYAFTLIIDYIIYAQIHSNMKLYYLCIMIGAGKKKFHGFNKHTIAKHTFAFLQYSP